jgi:hypothetical protein
MFYFLLQVVQFYALACLVRSTLFGSPSHAAAAGLSEKADIIFVMNELEKKADKALCAYIDGDGQGIEIGGEAPKLSIGASPTTRDVVIGSPSLSSNQIVRVGMFAFSKDGVDLSRNPRIVFRDNVAVIQVVNDKLCVRDRAGGELIALSDVKRTADVNSDRITTNKINHDDLETELRANYVSKQELALALSSLLGKAEAGETYLTRREFSDTTIEVAGYTRSDADSIFVSRREAQDVLVAKEVFDEEIERLEELIARGS